MEGYCDGRALCFYPVSLKQQFVSGTWKIRGHFKKKEQDSGNVIREKYRYLRFPGNTKDKSESEKLGYPFLRLVQTTPRTGLYNQEQPETVKAKIVTDRIRSITIKKKSNGIRNQVRKIERPSTK